MADALADPAHSEAAGEFLKVRKEKHCLRHDGNKKTRQRQWPLQSLSHLSHLSHRMQVVVVPLLIILRCAFATDDICSGCGCSRC